MTFRTVNHVIVVPADVAGLVGGSHGLGAEAQRGGTGARIAEAAGAQPDAAQAG